MKRNQIYIDIEKGNEKNFLYIYKHVYLVSTRDSVKNAKHNFNCAQIYTHKTNKINRQFAMKPKQKPKRIEIDKLNWLQDQINQTI